MLKSYEAIYKNGMLHWLAQIPPQRDKELRVLVVVEVNDAKPNQDKNETWQRELDMGKSVEKIDPEIDELLQKWLSGKRKKPQGGRLRPIIVGKTVAQRVLEDRGE
ncbi:MAG: hypothetical protein ABFS56_23755 [Pseudomonadota bacterium]